MGLLSQIGVGVESTYGTRVAPTRFYEFLDESLGRRNRTIESDGLRGAGRALRRGSRRALVGRDAAGQIRMEVGPDQFGLLFEHALGAVSTSTPAGGTDAREHLFTIGSLLGKSLTIQKGVEADDGTVVPFDYVGCKVGGWELSVTVDGFLLLQLDIDARDETTGETLGVASIPDGGLFHFAQATLRKDGSPLGQVSSCRISGSNPMQTEKYYLGNAGLKAEPTDNDGYPEITGEGTMTFSDLTSFHTAFAADTSLELELDFVAGEVESGQDEQLTVTLADVRFTGATPTVSGPQVPEVTVPFVAYEPSGGGEAIELLLRNGDATP